MTTMDNSITKKQLTTLALIGLVILVLFAAGFVWLYYYVGVLGNGGEDVFLAFATILDLSLPGRDQCLCRLFCGKICKRQMEACLALGNRWFCSDSPIHPWFSKLVITRISISKP